MFTVFESQRMDQLASRLVERFSQRRKSELSLNADTILIQHAGMTRWLKMQIAERCGIAANLDCTFPAAFLWKVYQAILPEQKLADESRYSSEHLTWSIVSVLPELVAERPDKFRQIRRYLDQPTDQPRPAEEQLKRLQLSARLAGLYEQYLLYRGDWIRAWEAGESINAIPAVHQWQADLWQALIEKGLSYQLPPGPHRVEIHQKFVARIEMIEKWPDCLPSQLSIFGISSLPPELLEALVLIGRRGDVDVDLYMMNPCIHYWGDIEPERAIARKHLKQVLEDEPLPEEDDYLLYGNPLLASMGQEGREFIDQIWEVDHAVVEKVGDHRELTESAHSEMTMLQFMQHEVHNLTLRGDMEPLSPEVLATDQGKLAVAEADHSIEVSSCYGAMREVEVLYDRVLYMLEQDASLTPRDILIMAPNISFYAPFIEAVFNSNVPGQPGLPFNISDRSLQEESVLHSSFLKLLDLPDCRFKASEILDLVSVPAIGQTFGVDTADDIETLVRWVTESGIRWGIDADFKQQAWQLPGVGNHSWAFGFDRLLLGYAMRSEHGLFDQRILPYGNISGRNSELLGQLISFIGTLDEFRKTLQVPRSLPDWQTVLNDLIKAFYQQDADTALEFRKIQQSINQLAQLAQDNELDEAFHHQTVSYWLKQQLAQTAAGHGFLSRGITFCNLVAMRNIPSRVICLIGMNDDDFPRNQTQPGFDLLAIPALRRRGDRSHRQDDRYMFLEALLAAGERLYISYIGRNDQDDKEREPSVLVTEVLDYCERAFCCDNNKQGSFKKDGAVRERLVTAYPLQPFGRRYFLTTDDNKQLFTYSQQWWSETLFDLPTDQSLYCKLRDSEGSTAIPLHQDQAESVIELEDLIAFFTNPAKYFFTRRLNVVFPRQSDEIKDEEPFSLDTLESYQLMDEQLQDEISDAMLEDWQDRQQAKGAVLPGSAGKNQLSNERNKLSPLLARLDEVAVNFDSVVAVDINTSIGGNVLQGQVKGIRNNTLVQYRPTDIRAKDRLTGWIRLLALQSNNQRCQHPFSLILLGRKGDGYRYTVTMEAAIQQMKSLLSLFLEGQQQPLFFIPDTSFEWQRNKHKDKPDEIARQAAIKAWEKSQYKRGDESDDYFSRTFDIPADFDDVFRELAASVFTPVLEAEKRITAKSKL